MKSYKEHVSDSISKYLLKLINEKGLNYEQISKEIQLMGGDANPNSVSNWVRGKSLPSAEKILILADCFGTSTDEILGAYDKEFYNK